MAHRRLTKTQRSLLTLTAGLVILGLATSAVVRSPSAREWSSEGHRLTASGQSQAALRAYTEAWSQVSIELEGAELETERVAILAGRGQCNLDLGRLEHALQDLAEARRLAPEDHEHWIREGTAYLMAARYREAANLYLQGSNEFEAHEELFRYAAGCATFQQACMELESAIDLLAPQLKTAARDELRKSLDRYVFDRVDMNTLIKGPWGSQIETSGSSVTQLLRSARKQVSRATGFLSGYLEYGAMDPGSASLVADLLRRSGRTYEMKRLSETILRLFPSDPRSTGMCNLLANMLFEMEAYSEAARLFLQNRGPLRQSGQSAAARRSEAFAIEAYLRNRQPKEALSVLDAPQILDTDNVVALFHLGWARWLNGERDSALRPIEKAVETLQLRQFGHAWARDPEHETWILESIADCLMQNQRYAHAEMVMTEAARRFPDDLRWPKALAMLPETSAGNDELPDQWLDILRRGRRHPASFDRWKEVSVAAWRTSDLLERQVGLHAQRILSRQSKNVISEREQGTGAFNELLRDRNRKSQQGRQNKSTQSTLRAKGSILLGELNRDPYLALQVYEQLLREAHREHAYLVLLALCDVEPKIEQFRYMLAEHEFADGELGLAAQTWGELFEQDPTDWRSASHAWIILKRFGQRSEVAKLESAALEADPEGAGRMLATWSCLWSGFHEQAVALAEACQLDRPVEAFTRGLGALAAYRLGDESRAREWSKEVLAKDEQVVPALTTIMVLANKRKNDTETEAHESWLNAHADRLSVLEPADLSLLARTLIEERQFSLSQQVLRWILDQDGDHVLARRDLVDTLLALDRTAEAVKQLDRLEEITSLAIDRERRALLLLLDGDLESCYAHLRNWAAQGLGTTDTATWLAMVGAATGRLDTALRSLPDDQNLSPEAARFLALQVSLAEVQDIRIGNLPNMVKTRIESLAVPLDDQARDRDLERAISIELAAENPGELSRTLLPIILLAGHQDLAPLRELLEAKAHLAYPGLSDLALREARRQQARGRLSIALQTLIRHFEQDPTDPHALALAQSWTNDLTRSQLNSLIESVSGSALPPGMIELVTGLRATDQGDIAVATEHLEKAVELVDPAGLALIPLLRLGEQSSLVFKADPYPHSPFEAIAAKQAARRSSEHYERQVEAALGSHPDDTPLRLFVAEMLVNADPSTISPRLKQRFIRVLLERPAPPWITYERGAAMAAEGAPDSEPLLQMTVALRTARQRFPHAEPDLHLAHSYVHLARGLRRFGEMETARSLLRSAENIAPYDAALLIELAHHEETLGHIAKAAEFRARTVLCGNQDTELLAWLAADAIDRRRDIDAARDWSSRAIALLDDETPAADEATARRIRARIAYVEGDLDLALAQHKAAAKALDVDIDLDYDVALELFAGGSRNKARRALSAVLEAPDAPTDLIERALESYGLKSSLIPR